MSIAWATLLQRVTRHACTSVKALVKVLVGDAGRCTLAAVSSKTESNSTIFTELPGRRTDDLLSPLRYERCGEQRESVHYARTAAKETHEGAKVYHFITVSPRRSAPMTRERNLGAALRDIITRGLCKKVGKKNKRKGKKKGMENTSKTCVSAHGKCKLGDSR